MVFAVREPIDLPELTGLPELIVKGLADRDVRLLLASVIPGRLDERVRDRIVAETRGHPLALLELPRGMTPADLAGGFGLPDAGSLTVRIEHTFVPWSSPIGDGDPTRPTSRTTGAAAHAARCTQSSRRGEVAMMKLRSHREVLDIMRRVGMGDQISEAMQKLPDVIDLDRDEQLLYGMGLTLDRLVDRHGGSAW